MNQNEVVRQLQLAIQISTKENVELRERVHYLEMQLVAEKNLEIQKLKQQNETLLEQLRNFPKFESKDHSKYEDIIEQLNLRLLEKQKLLSLEAEANKKLVQKATQLQTEVQSIRDQMEAQNNRIKWLEERNYQLDQLLLRVRSKENTSVHYLQEIERLNAQLSSIRNERSQGGLYQHSRLTYQS